MILDLHVLALGIACISLVTAMLWDVAFRTIPNGLSAMVAVSALMLRGMEGELLDAILAAVLCFSAATVCWLRGWLGGGDVKLLTAAILLVAPSAVPGLLAEIVFAGGVLALSYLLLSLVVRPPHGARPVMLLRRIIRVERWRVSRRRSVPYGCAIAAGAFLVLLNG